MNSSPSPISDFVRSSKRPTDTVASQLPPERVEETSHRSFAKKRPRKRLTKRFYVIGVSILLLFVILGAVAYRVVSTRPIIDSAVVAKADFPVYAPSTLPKDYAVKKDATNINNGVLIYTLEDQKTNTEITVTVQPWPVGFDMSKMVEGGSINGSSAKTGTLYNLSTENSTKYLLNMGSTLIFLTSSKRVDAAAVYTLVDSLEKVN